MSNLSVWRAEKEFDSNGMATQDTKWKSDFVLLVTYWAPLGPSKKVKFIAKMAMSLTIPRENTNVFDGQKVRTQDSAYFPYL